MLMLSFRFEAIAFLKKRIARFNYLEWLLSVRREEGAWTVKECAPLPAKRWDKAYTRGDHMALCVRPCRSLRRSCTAGRWSPSRSRARTAPASPWCGPLVLAVQPTTGQGSRCVHQETGNCTRHHLNIC